MPSPSETRNRSDAPSARDEYRAEERFQLAAKASQDLLWDWDLTKGEVVWAGATQPYFGVPPEDIAPSPADQYRAWAGRVHPDDLTATETATRAAIESGAESWEHEYRFRRVDDSYAQVLDRAFIVRDQSGRAIRIVGAMQDLTKRQDVERATTRLAAIVASSSDAIVGKTLDGVVTSWNAAAERMFGYSEAEMLGRSIFVLVPEELLDTERELLLAISRGERVNFAETLRVRKDGTKIHIALTVSPIWDPSGVVVGASSIKRDITDRKRANEELARREERYRALVQATTSIVWIAGSDGRFDDAQPAWESYTGQPWREQEGFGWLNAIHPDDQEAARASWAQARGTSSIWELRARLWSRAHQGYRHFVARAVPVLGPDGSVREWVGAVTDAEDRWKAEEQLRQADRMESVGRLAGGVAHEANNQMTVILGAAEFLNRAIPDERTRIDVDHIRRAARRTAAITQQLLAFSRRQVLQPEMVDLSAVVVTLEPILRRALGEVSRVELRLGGDLGPVKADPGQLDQVLLNLALNARDAMPDGGTLTIETANVTVDERHLTAKTMEPVVPGAYAVLRVIDTGVGMSRETLEHIFEPFFTTKSVGEGTGLGLATVYGIVKQSDGFVSVQSEPGHGSSFQIYLPLAGDRAGAAMAPVSTMSGGGTESILVAEDEPGVRAIIARALREYGYAVIEARDGYHALELAGAAAIPARPRHRRRRDAGYGWQATRPVIAGPLARPPGALHVRVHRVRCRAARSHGRGERFHAEAAGARVGSSEGPADSRRASGSAGALTAIDLSQCIDRIRLRGGLVRPVPLYPGEPEGEAAGVLRARLQVVERHFHHQLRPDVDGVGVPADFQLAQPVGLPAEHLVGHPLECLPEHDETAGRFASAEVEVAEPPATPAAAPLGGQHHEIDRPNRLHLEPAAAPPAGLVGRIQRLQHHPFVAACHRRAMKLVRLLGRRGDDPGNQQRGGNGAGQQLGPAMEWLVEQRDAVEIEDVEDEQGHRELVPHPLDIEPAAEAPHGGLEGQGTAVGPERDRLALDDEFRCRESPRRLHQLRDRAGHLVEASGVDPDLVAPPVDLDPGPVELVLHGRLAQLGESLVYVFGTAGKHRQYRLKECHGELGQPLRSAAQRRGGHGRQVSRHHDRTPHLGGRPAGRACDRLHHQSLERTLPQPSHEQCYEKPLLLHGEARQQVAQQPPAHLSGALAGHSRDPIEHRVHLAQLDRRGVRCRARHRLTDRGAAEAELVLPHRAGEKGGGQLDFAGWRFGQERREQADFLEPARGLGDPPGGLGQRRQLQGRAAGVVEVQTVADLMERKR